MSLRVAAMVVRADKQARAAVQNFDSWYARRLAHFGPYLYECRLDNSPLTVARCAAPHSMLYFLIQVLQRLVHQFWDTAHLDSYVRRCAHVNGRCPPSIIALLFYLECRDLSPNMSVAIPDTKKQRIHDSEAARAAAQAAPSAASAEAAASEDAARVQAEHDAFWQTFAENVMKHLVWPAVWKGIIRVAPNSDRDNPTWWSEGILPIVNHSEVFSLHWQGGKKMARHSWYHVCAVLATHNFADQGGPKPFTQKTVREFLEDAGYRKALATDDVAATEVTLATTSKAASGVCTASKAASVAVHGAAAEASAVEPPPGVWSLSSEAPAAKAVPGQSRNERARLRAEVARRYAYSQLDQHARRTIASAEWCWLSSPSVCEKIRKAFATYQDSSEFTREPLDVKAVVAEIRLTVEYFSQTKLWPRWVLQPNDRLVRSLPEDEAAYEDFGNENWEALVNLMNLSSVIHFVCGQAVFNAPANAVYGDRLNRSSVGSYNFRGNVVERLLTYLLHRSQEEALAVSALPASG